MTPEPTTTATAIIGLAIALSAPITILVFRWAFPSAVGSKQSSEPAKPSPCATQEDLRAMERTMCEEFLPREVFDAEQKGVERELVNLRTTIDRYMVKQDTTNAELFKKIDHLANVVLNGVKK
jgi:hypothetical protein